ncbi:MAG: hypothetical protein ABI583_12335 [Betaproteobacteria bacterium]
MNVSSLSYSKKSAAFLFGGISSIFLGLLLIFMLYGNKLFISLEPLFGFAAVLLTTVVPISLSAMGIFAGVAAISQPNSNIGAYLLLIFNVLLALLLGLTITFVLRGGLSALFVSH